MNNLVVIEKGEPKVSTLKVADGVKKDHHSVSVLVKKYSNELQHFGTLEFKIQKSGGRPTEYWMLNEQQTTFLITLMRNTDIVVNFKMSLVKEFYRMKLSLMEVKQRQNNEEWKKLRTEGKKSRKEETDSIKEFVDYCRANGSKNADTYYKSITNMEHKALFVLEQEFKGVRDFLNGQQLMVVSTADQIVSKALKDGMDANMEYHDIFKLAKERILGFAKVIPKTPVIMLDEIKQLTFDFDKEKQDD